MLFIRITCQCPYIISQHSGQFLLKKKNKYLKVRKSIISYNFQTYQCLNRDIFRAVSPTTRHDLKALNYILEAGGQLAHKNHSAE